MRITRPVTPSRAGIRGRVRSHASRADICWPRTARLTAAVRMPLSTRTANAVITASMPPLVIAPASTVRSPSGSALLVETEVSIASCSSSHFTGTLITWVSAATTAERPSMTRQCRRIAAIAPSRISPTPNGRSGMIPGFGDCGGAVV